MRIGIITCPRDGHVDYLNSTIASMLQKDTGVFCTDIAVFSDNAETPQMAWPVHHVEPLTKQHDDRRKKDKVIIHRPFLKALRWIADSDGIGIVAEDDIKCASRWASRVKDLSEVCDSVVGSVWIMPLMHFYAFSDFVPCGLVPGVSHCSDMLVRWRDPGIFYGNQCVVYSHRAAVVMRDRFAEWFDNNQAGKEPWYPPDILVGKTSVERNIPMVSPHPCLVQHVGEQTVACKGRQLITTRYFEE
jgi:hypothetical protein